MTAVSPLSRNPIERLLQETDTNFRSVLALNQPVFFSVLGLDALLSAARDHQNLVDVAPALSKQIAKNLPYVAPRLADAVAGSLAPHRVYFGLAASDGLLTLRDDPFRDDRALHAGMLMSALRAIMFRHEIDSRGDPLSRTALPPGWAISECFSPPADPEFVAKGEKPVRYN